MRNACRLSIASAVLAVGITLVARTGQAESTEREAVAVESLEGLARRAGLRVLAGRHLVLATDRPARAGDGVEELPAVFDQAFDAWCRHYGMDPAAHAGWRCFGCLVVNPERFRAAGLLPDTVPRFENGFCSANRFWLREQSNPAYRRHLLLHEGAHAFTLTLRGMAAPLWYNEGIAEFLATHRLEFDAEGGPRFVHTPIPDRPSDVEQLGRIETLRELRATGQAPALEDVLALSVGEHGAIADYAASWAAVALLAGHPTSAGAFATLERGPLEPDFNARLAALPGWDAARAARDFDAFTAEVDYGWSFPRMAIDWSAGEPLQRPRTVAVEAGRGWQNSGARLVAGRHYSFTAAGRAEMGTVEDGRSGQVTTLESEADGMSLEWYRGRPVGRLLAAQWVEPADGGRPRFEILAEGKDGEFTGAVAGPLYLRLNGPPGRLAERAGAIAVTLVPLP